MSHQGQALEDIKQSLLQLCETLRLQEESLFELQVQGAALLAASEERDPAFAAAYRKHYEDTEKGPLADDHAKALRLISDAVWKLKELES